MSMSFISSTEAIQQLSKPINEDICENNNLESLESLDPSEGKQLSLYSLKLKEYGSLCHITDLIPCQAQRGLKTFDISFLCLDVTSNYVAIGSNIGTLYLYERHTGQLHKLRYESYIGLITTVQIYPGSDSFVAFGTADGFVLVFEVPSKDNNYKPHRYDVINVHSNVINALEWKKEGNQLYSGDQSGFIIETSFDFLQKTCKSREIIKEPWGIVQISHRNDTLVVSTLQRGLLIYFTKDGIIINQIGQRDRKSYGKYGVLSFTPDHIFTSRPGFRLWKADSNGTVLETMLVKKSLESLNYVSISLLNGNCTVLEADHSKNPQPLNQLEKLKHFQELFILTWNRDSIIIIDPEIRSVIASCQNLGGNLIDVAVHQNEIFFLQESRNIRRVGSEPEDILYPQVNVPRPSKDDFSILSTIASPFQDLIKKSTQPSNKNEADSNDNPKKVLAWLKNLTSPDKNTLAKEMKPLILPPIVNCELSEPIQLQQPNLDIQSDNIATPLLKKQNALEDDQSDLVYKPKKKKKPKRKSKDYVDTSSLERSSDGLQWDGFQSNSPGIFHDLPLEFLENNSEALPTDKENEIKIEVSKNSSSVPTETEDERLTRILDLYESRNKSDEIDDASKSDEPNEISKSDQNNTEEKAMINVSDDSEKNVLESQLENFPLTIESPCLDIYSQSEGKYSFGNSSEFSPETDNSTYETRDSIIDSEKLELPSDEAVQKIMLNSNSDVAVNVTVPEENEFKHSIDEWLQHKLPTSNSVISIAVNASFVYIVDSKENIYYSPIIGHYFKWQMLETPANQVSLCETNDLIWILHQGILYTTVLLPNGKPKLPLLIGAESVTSMALNNDSGWFISNGKLYAQLNLSSNNPCSKKSTLVPKQQCFTKHISLFDNIVWLSTHEGQLFCLTGVSKSNPLGIEFRKIHLPSGVKDVPSFTLSRNGTAWIAHERGIVFVKTGISHLNPTGTDGWFEIEMNQYLPNELDAKTPKVVKITTDRIKHALTGHHKPTITSSEKGVIFYNGFTLMASRDNVSAHKWKLVKQEGTSTSLSFKWSVISAAGANSREDPIWAVYATGEIFCLNQIDGQPITVNAPNSDRSSITCLASTPGFLWVLTSSGEIYARNEISVATIQGTYWTRLEDSQLDGVQLTHMSCSMDILWACDKFGTVWVRVGPLVVSKTLAPAWINIDEIDDNSLSMTMVSVGVDPTMVWGMNRSGDVYVRKGVTDEMPIGDCWEVVPGIQAKCLTVSKSEVFALTMNGEVYYRYGIDSSNVSGDAWLKLPGMYDFLSVSPKNSIWALDQNGNLLHHATSNIQFNSKRSVHARQNYLRYAPDMGDEWEVL